MSTSTAPAGSPAPEAAPAGGPARLGEVLLRRLPVVLLAVFAGLLGVRLLAMREAPRAKGLPTFYQVPVFSFTDQTGKPYGTEQLDGKVWVGSFLFTRCRTICPLVVERMKKLDGWFAAHPEYAGRLQLVSITVDPGHDTPSVLAKFGRERGIDPARWRLLNGPADALEKVVADGFKLSIGKPEVGKAGDLQIVHSSRLVLVDADGRIRGYYQDDPQSTRRLKADLERLLSAGGAGPVAEAP